MRISEIRGVMGRSCTDLDGALEVGPRNQLFLEQKQSGFLAPRKHSERKKCASLGMTMRLKRLNIVGDSIVLVHRSHDQKTQLNLFRSIFGSHTSVDFISSSQVTSRPVYAAVRAIIHESADSAPLAA